MAHNIAEDKNHQPHVFVVGEPAWHRVGPVLKDAATAEVAIATSHLDFTVAQKVVTFTVGKKTYEFPGRFVNYRTDDNRPLGVVGSGYKLVQNVAAFSFFDAIVDKDEAIYHSAGALGNGETIWIMAKMPPHVCIKVGKDDLTEMYVLLYNSHAGNGSIIACLTPVRVVCQNTLLAAIGSTKHKVMIRHTSSAEQKLKEAHKLLGMSNQYREELQAAFNSMAARKINPEDAEQFFLQLYPKTEGNENETAGSKIRREMLECFECAPGHDLKTANGTLFGLYNAVTYHLDHYKEFKAEDARLKSMWLGGGAETRQKAFNLAVEWIKR
jgi:phage/plasmid-like protein (TIGR03299 family)